MLKNKLSITYKRLLSFILVLLPVFVEAQKNIDTLIALPVQDGKVFYQKGFSDSAAKNDLFIKAKNVFIRLFPATKDVIQNEDKDNGIISGKGSFSVYTKGGITGGNSDIKMTITIVVKDSKYKVDIFDFSLVAKSLYEAEGPIESIYKLGQKKNRPYWRKFFVSFNERVLQLFDQINSEMSKKLITDF